MRLFLLLLFITSSSVIAGSSLYERGKVYYYGSAESAIDYEKAFNIFEHASKIGDLDAKTALGVMHIEGKGTHQDDQKGVLLLEEVANKDHAKAQYY
jgi:FOG: TPR repeat, SEL1 subfamily